MVRVKAQDVNRTDVKELKERDVAVILAKILDDIQDLNERLNNLEQI